MIAVDTRDRSLQALLQTYSTEVLAKDRKRIDEAGELLAPGAEVFVAKLPGDSAENLVTACTALRRSGLTPVPHITARTVPHRHGLGQLLEWLTGEAAVDRALVIGGDMDRPVGEFDAAIQLLETGLFQHHGIRTVALAVHPERHPRVADEVMRPALAPKLAATAAAGLDTFLVSQFAFDPAPYLAMARHLRAEGVTAPLRVGVAGPARRTTLLKYAMMCGVGPSLRALKERQDLARSVAAGETPEALLRSLAEAQAAEPELGIAGVHFFTFGSLADSVRLAETLRRGSSR